jgi:hypothetical protein
LMHRMSLKRRNTSSRRWIRSTAIASTTAFASSATAEYVDEGFEYEIVD